MAEYVNCPKCDQANCVKVKRNPDGNVGAFACNACGRVYKAKWSWEQSAYYGLELNPEFSSKSDEFWTSLSEILELEKQGIPQFLGAYKMLEEDAPEE